MGLSLAVFQRYVPILCALDISKLVTSLNYELWIFYLNPIFTYDESNCLKTPTKIKEILLSFFIENSQILQSSAESNQMDDVLQKGFDLIQSAMSSTKLTAAWFQ